MLGTTKKEQQPAWKRRANGKQNKQLEAGSQDPDSTAGGHRTPRPGLPSP